MTRTTPHAPPALALRELPVPDPAERVVFVTNAVRRRGGLRTRGEQQHRPVGPVLAAVLTR